MVFWIEEDSGFDLTKNEFVNSFGTRSGTQAFSEAMSADGDFSPMILDGIGSDEDGYRGAMSAGRRQSMIGQLGGYDQRFWYWYDEELVSFQSQECEEISNCAAPFR